MLSLLVLPAIASLWGPSTTKLDLTKDPTLYIVGYAHLDTQWRWVFPQTIGEFLPKTMKNNFVLFEKYPNYVFNFTGSNRYRLMKEYWPADYAKMKEYIAKGKWFPAGSSVEEGDVNSPSLESLVRQVLYGNEYFDKEFGKHSDEYMLPDCFGFPAALPSILAHCGVKGFSTQKLTWGFPGNIPFDVGVWVGPDGKGVISALNPGPYDQSIRVDLAEDPRWLDRIKKDGVSSGSYAAYMYYGTGDTGGAPNDASVALAEKAITENGPLKVIGGRADNLFNDLTAPEVAKLPRYQGDLELTGHSAGSITSEAEHKRWNHENEKLAQAAEEASVAAGLVGHADYPMDTLMSAWYLFLAGQFHDTMAGTALPEAYSFAWNDDCIAMNEFQSTMDSGVATVTRALDTSGAGTPVVVFNPTSLPRHDLVEATVPVASAERGIFAITPSGKQEVAQRLGWDNGKAHIVFQADASSVSWGVYRIVNGDKQADASNAQEHTLENSKLKVTINEAGDVSSVIDKASGKETLAGPIRLALMHENPVQWPAWNMDWLDQQKPPYGYVDGPAEIKVTASGPLRGEITVTRFTAGSKFIQRLRLDKDSDRLEFNNSIDWKTKATALKQEFKLAASNPNATYNWQVGTIERGNNNKDHFEVGSQRWFDLTDASGGFGASVLTGSKIGSDKPDDQTVRLTLLYSPGVKGGYQDQYSQDWGHHEIIYAFLPHSGDWKAGGTSKEAVEDDQPMFAYETAPHKGGATKELSLVGVDNPHLTIVAVKKAEYGNDIIVRVRENDGMAQSGVTLKFATPVKSAHQVDGQEKTIGDAQVADGQLKFDIGSYGIMAFDVKLNGYAKPVSAVASQPVSLPYNADVISMPDKLDDGDFDGTGRTIAGDQLPDTLDFTGVHFKFGPKGVAAKNAVSCTGQSVSIPKGSWRSIHVLAASTDGPVDVMFGIGSTGFPVTVDSWGGYFGAWDTRIWGGTDSNISEGSNNTIIGIEPGHIRTDRIAWNCDHQHSPQGNAIYKYSYLYDYTLPLNHGDRSLNLPSNPKVKVLAVSVSSEPADGVTEANKVVDQLNQQLDAPKITPDAGAYHDSMSVTIAPGMYGRTDRLVYSINDGAEQPYRGPIFVASDATITARVGAGPAAKAEYKVDDTTAPSVVEAVTWPGLGFAEIKFSEPVNRVDAENLKTYDIRGSGKISGAKLSGDNRTVTFTIDGEVTGITVSDIRDVSPHENKLTGSFPLTPATPAYAVDDYAAAGRTLTKAMDGLPVQGDAPWTLNFFVKTDTMPGDRTPIAGFGESRDGDNGASRYIVKFPEGLRFWGCNVDISMKAQLELGAWQMLTATFDGHTVTVYKNGKKMNVEAANLNDAPSVAKLAPVDGWGLRQRFRGEIKKFTIWSTALDGAAVQKMYDLNKGSL